jgi:hypothetical protein
MVSSRNWTHLIRFIATEDGQTHLGQIDVAEWPDVGIAAFEGKKITARVVSGSIYDGIVTDRLLHVERVRLHSPPSNLYLHVLIWYSYLRPSRRNKYQLFDVSD